VYIVLVIAVIQFIHMWIMCLYFFYDDLGAFHLFDHLAIKRFLILLDYNLNSFQILVIIAHLYFLVFLDQNFNSINPLPLPLLFPLFNCKVVL